jgi:hypothetical protein
VTKNLYVQRPSVPTFYAEQVPSLYFENATEVLDFARRWNLKVDVDAADLSASVINLTLLSPDKPKRVYFGYWLVRSTDDGSVRIVSAGDFAREYELKDPPKPEVTINVTPPEGLDLEALARAVLVELRKLEVSS